jgi:hypothetical protein
MSTLSLDRLRKEAPNLRKDTLGVLLRWGQESPAWEIRLPFQRVYLFFQAEAVETFLLSNTNSGQRVSECRRVELGVAAAPLSGRHAHLLLTLRRPLT